MTKDAQPDDPLFGIEFSVDELRELIAQYTVEIGEYTEDTETSLLGSTVLSWAIEVLPIAAGIDNSDPNDDEALAMEEYIASVAARELDRLIDTSPTNPSDAEKKLHLVKRLKSQTRTPLRDKKLASQDAQKAEQRKAKIAELQTDIEAQESLFTVSSNRLRELSYDSVGKIRNGIWLRRQISDIEDPGSQEKLFRNEEAQILASLSLGDLTHLAVSNIKDKLDGISEIQQKIITLGGIVEPGIFRAMQTLKELHEGGNGQLHANAELAPLRHFANMVFKDSNELLDSFLNTLDEGPFSNCDELPVSPFAAEAFDDEVRSVVEIEDELVTAENIREDIDVAVEKSEGKGYIVEQARIDDFIELRNKLIHSYGQNSVRTIRTLSSKWHPLPWYALEITQENENPRVIMESPIWGNASYFLHNDDWVGTISLFNRRDAQKLGAKPRVHKYGHEGKPVAHVDKLYRLVRSA